MGWQITEAGAWIGGRDGRDRRDRPRNRTPPSLRTIRVSQTRHARLNDLAATDPNIRVREGDSILSIAVSLRGPIRRLFEQLIKPARRVWAAICARCGRGFVRARERCAAANLVDG